MKIYTGDYYFQKSYGEGWLEYMSNIGVMTKKDQIPPRLQSGYYSEEFNSGFTGDLIIPEASPNNPVQWIFILREKIQIKFLLT